MANLTGKQERFVKEYLADNNATQAAIRAGYSPKCANDTACKIMKSPAVRARLEEALEKRSERTKIRQDRVILELARVAFANVADLVDFTTGDLKPDVSQDDTAAIAGAKIRRVLTAEGECREVQIRMADKLRALELLGRHLGLFTDNLNPTGNLGVVIVNDIPRPSKNTA